MSEENLTKKNEVSLKELEFLIKSLFEKFNKSEIILDEIEEWNGKQ